MNHVPNFEWDRAKAAANRAKHGVTFEEAIEVFRDPFAMEVVDDREAYDEERFIIIGTAIGNLLTVVYTDRSGSIRIISARKAARYERIYYYRQNAP